MKDLVRDLENVFKNNLSNLSNFNFLLFPNLFSNLEKSNLFETDRLLKIHINHFLSSENKFSSHTNLQNPYHGYIFSNYFFYFKKRAYHAGYNILSIYSVLVEVWFALCTNKAGLVI